MNNNADSDITRSRLVRRHEVAERTAAFHFEKPPGWTFEAGQFFNITLPDPPETDAEGNTRTFTIASAPHEDTLMIATRLRDTAFKRVLQTMPLGSEVRIEGPWGDLTLHTEAARPAVFLAGGIGITPFRSIVLHAAKEKLPHRILLFYSNHRPEDAPFLEDLQTVETENPNYKLIATMTKMSASHAAWQGETGQIGPAMLSKYLKETSSPIFYVAGPPGMVKGLQAMVKSFGVADADIRAEEFDGY